MGKSVFATWNKASAQVRFLPSFATWEIKTLSSLMGAFQIDVPSSFRKAFLAIKMLVRGFFSLKMRKKAGQL